MCNCVKTNYEVYNNLNIDQYLKTVDYDFQNNVFSDKLKQYLTGLLKYNADKLPVLSPFLQMWIEDRLLESNKLDEFIKDSYKVSVKNNIFNFSLAKSFKFLSNVKTFLKEKDKEVVKDNINKLADITLNAQQSIENWQVEHITDNINKIVGTSPDSQLVEYVSMEDSKVRPTHSEANGTILYKNSDWWQNTGFKLLSEWNCRCHIVNALPDAKPTTAPVITLDTKGSPSAIDFKEDRAIIFKQNIPVFEGTSIIRTRYKQSGF